MKGLELSKQYYHRFCVPMIEKKFAGFKGRIAAGAVGEDQSFGFDDEISRDHDWGPSVCLWLNKEDHAAIGKDLQNELDKLPKEFKGFSRLESSWGSGRTGVFETGYFYKRLIGFDHVPVGLHEWRLVLKLIWLRPLTAGYLLMNMVSSLILETS